MDRVDAVGAGLCNGAAMAGISISGGETSQLKEIVTGFDLVGMAVGRVALDKVISGKTVVEGDVVIGVRSSGVHSNGLSLARKAFFANDRYGIDHKFDELGTTIGEAAPPAPPGPPAPPSPAAPPLAPIPASPPAPP